MKILDKAEKKIKEVAKCIKDKYDKISQNEKIKDKTQKYFFIKNKTINEIFNYIKNNIKNKPIKSIIISLSIGFIIGFIIKKNK